MIPEKRIMDKVRKEQLAKGIPESQIDKEQLSFCLSIANNYRSTLIIEYNKQIANGIRNLSMENDWSNLIKVSKHALEESINALKKDEETFPTLKLTNSLKIKLDILKTGSADFEKIFKPEYLNKFK